jgi:hypothetical protein
MASGCVERYRMDWRHDRPETHTGGGAHPTPGGGTAGVRALGPMQFGGAVIQGPHPPFPGGLDETPSPAFLDNGPVRFFVVPIQSPPNRPKLRDPDAEA